MCWRLRLVAHIAAEEDEVPSITRLVTQHVKEPGSELGVVMGVNTSTLPGQWVRYF